MGRLLLALHYLLARRVNLVAMLGTALGVAALIVVVSIFSGYIREIRRHVHDAASDLVVQLSRPTSFDALVKVIEADPNVKACSPRLVWYGLLNSLPGQQRRLPSPSPHGLPADYLTLVGIDPEREARTTGYAHWVTGVENPALRASDPATALASDPPGILLNEQRMTRLQMALGTAISLTSAKLAGKDSLENLQIEFRIAGAFSTPHAGFDEGNAFVPIAALRTLLFPEPANAVTEVVVRLVDESLQAETRERLMNTLSEQAGIDRPNVLGWQDRNKIFLSAVDHQRGLMKLVLLVIIVVAIFLVFATLSMMVSEKTRDIGTLTALGATPFSVMQVFLTCGIALTATGALLGAFLGCLAAIWLDPFNQGLRATLGIDLFPTAVYNLKHVPYELEPSWIATVVGVTLLLGILASGIPALRAARHDPLVSLRHE